MTKQEKINSFLAEKDIAMAGASRDSKKFGYKVFQLLKNKGYNVFPIHPQVKEIDNTSCYVSVNEVPEQVINLYVVTPKQATYGIVKDALAKGYKKIWIQQTSDTPETIELLKQSGIEYITGQCMFMYLHPHGIHGFHRWMVELFKK